MPVSSLHEEEKTDPVVLESRFAAPATEVVASFSIMRGIPAVVDGDAFQEPVDVTQKMRRLIEEILDRGLLGPTASCEFEALEIASSQSEGAIS